MKHSEVFRARGRSLTGRYPSPSIGLTRECPLRCPGCSAHEPAHLGAGVGPLRSLDDASDAAGRRLGRRRGA